MKNIPLLPVVFLAGLVSLPAAAENSSFTPSSYFGLHLGQGKVAPNDASQNFSYLNVGFNFGYFFKPNIAVELYGSFSSDGERDEVTSRLLGSRVKAEHNVVGAYLIGQSSGRFYAKGRLGMAQSRFTYSASGFEDESEGSVGLSYGLGAGVELGSVNLELDHIIFPSVDDPIYQGTSYDIAVTSMSLVWRFPR